VRLVQAGHFQGNEEPDGTLAGGQIRLLLSEVRQSLRVMEAQQTVILSVMQAATNGRGAFPTSKRSAVPIGFSG
jgi:hypothetical protein